MDTFKPGDLLVRSDMKGALWLVCHIADVLKKGFPKGAEFVLVLLTSLQRTTPTLCDFNNRADWCNSAGLRANNFRKVGELNTGQLLTKVKEL